jgi:hypothetical protein
MHTTKHDKSMTYKHFRKKYMNAENSQIVTLLKGEILNINANNENNEHESRGGI